MHVYCCIYVGVILNIVDVAIDIAVHPSSCYVNEKRKYFAVRIFRCIHRSYAKLFLVVQGSTNQNQYNFSLVISNLKC